MADPSRFPSLTLPFAITGASAGFLTTGLTPHWILHGEKPEARAWIALMGGVFGGLLGFALHRLSAGKRYSWDLIAADPDTRPPTDRWYVHLFAIWCAAAAIGASYTLFDYNFEAKHGVWTAILLATPFLPTCFAVLWFARRAQRARLGSVVAASDRRAVWGIFAVTLSVVTLEALPQSPLLEERFVLYGKAPSVALVIAIAATSVAVLLLDVQALGALKRATAACLVRHEEEVQRDDASEKTHLDVGLGAGLLAHKEVSPLVYRGRDRILALIEGDPQEALAALGGAIKRGIAGTFVAAAVLALHLGADGRALFLRYEQWRCADGHPWCCRVGAKAAAEDREKAVMLLERGCDDGDGHSCLALATRYRGDAALTTRFEFRAAQRGYCPSGMTVVWRSGEGMCYYPHSMP